MGHYQSVFCHKEIKYLLDEDQAAALKQVLESRTLPDAFPVSAISNLYYDTPDFRLIRLSMEKPIYKEKLRLRCYQIPQASTPAFVEIKKKYAGVVYKRRVCLPYRQALAYLAAQDPGDDSQIFHELDWLLRFYGRLAPAMVLSYNRFSLKGAENPTLRITFDRDIHWRTDCLDLSGGVWGAELLRPGTQLLEIKTAGALPIWLAETLSRLRIFPAGFSKYGAAYQTWLRQGEQEEQRYA